VAFASTEGRAKVGNGGGDDGDDRHGSTRGNHGDDRGTERLLPEDIDETLTDLLFGEVPSVANPGTPPNPE
jgi:hypothetical protein